MTSPQPVEGRDTFVKDLVMNSMADDYEELETIIRGTAAMAKIRGVIPTREEIIKALKTVIAAGYAQSYFLSPYPSQFAAVDFDLRRVDEFYYYLTPAGKQIVKNTDQLGVSGGLLP